MDINKIKQRLNALTSKTKSKKDLFWKPTPGKFIVRIVPYKFSTDGTPFIELKFHYGINGKTYLSPDTFGRPDPIVEFSNRLKKTGSKEDWLLGKKMEPKQRIYVPVIVRGEESAGVKFWGFGKTIYQELMNVMVDPDFGDITDTKTGRDIIVECKAPEETGKAYIDTSIRMKPNPTVAVAPELLSKLDEQINLVESYEEKSYDDLKKIMEEWMTSSNAAEASSGDVSANDASVESAPEAVRSPSAVASIANKEAGANDFEQLFGKKS